MSTRFSEATDGRKLIHVEDRLQSPDADAPQVQVTYEMHIPNDWTISSDLKVLIPLSTVRTDTYEPVTLDREQASKMLKQAVQTAANFDPDW